MSIKVALEHSTRYDFAHPVAVTPHVVRLRPAPHTRTPIEAYSLKISPEEHFINWQQDPFGNWLARIVFPEKISHLEITVGLVADMMVINPLDFFIEEYAERFPFSYDTELASDLAPYLRPAEDGLHGAHGTRRADAGPDPRARNRLLPRQRLVAGGSAAPVRAGRALRVRVPGAADL
jgi:transglutaminase-like putative cysteine protease